METFTPMNSLSPKTPNTTRLTRKSVMNRSISKRNYQWDLARLSPNEYYEYLKTGVYPLAVKSPKENDSL